MIPTQEDTAGRFRRLAWLGLLLVSAVLHLWGLGDRSYHHDESLHARMSWDLVERGAYRYDPTYHGPVLYMATAALFAVAPDTDFTARLPVAAAGVGLLWVCWGLRRHIGESAALWTGLLVTISPSLLYFGRFLRMDLPELLFASAALLAFLDALAGRPRAWVALGVWSGLALSTKENVYVTSALLAATAVFVAVDRGLVESLRTVLPWLVDQRRNLIVAAGIAVALSTTLYTVGWTRPGDALFPVRAIGYWWNQHEIQRVAGPWWFHLPRLLQYEFLVVAAAGSWCVFRLRRLGTLELSLMVFGTASIVMYAYLGEKVPWLVVHQSWALFPLAGLCLAHVFGPEGRRGSRVLAAVGLAATAVWAWTASFVLEEISPEATRVESLHYVQTTPEFSEMARFLASLDSDVGSLQVQGNAIWPLNWYLRGRLEAWRPSDTEERPAVVVCDLERSAEVRTWLGEGYTGHVVPIRSWWLMEAGSPTIGDWLLYLTTRQHWGKIGSTECVVLARDTVAVP